MKGDFSRMTQGRSVDFSGVRMQQGRVQLDADFNEEVEIEARRDRVTTRDVIGPCGAPDSGGGFAIGTRARLNALDVAGATVFAVGAAGTILRSVDGGATWTVQAVPAGFDDDLLAVDFAVLAQVAGAPAPQAAIAVGSGPSVLYTTDGGTSWKPGALPAGTSGALRGVSFCDTKLGWAVGDAGLVVASRDAGATWTRQEVPPEAVETLHAVHFADDQTGWAVGDGGRMLATTDGGASWQVQGAPGVGASLRGVRFAGLKDGFAVGEGAIVVATEDGGATWVDRPLAGETATLRGVDVDVDVDVDNPKTATVAGDGPLLRRTTDGGESWTPLPAPAGAGDLSAVRTPGAGILVAGDLDTLGRSAVVAPPAWQPVAIPPHAAGDLAISPGRIYVDGVLYENHRWTRYGEQPDLPLAPTPTAAGRYIAYLDGWERHVTALERPELREVALGGPDTTTRTQNVWQVRLDGPFKLAGCGSVPADYRPAKPPASTGRMRARGAPAPLQTTECMVPAQGGYRRLENQLYRVEVVADSTSPAPAFAWSRDNATMAARLDRIDPGASNDRTRLVASDPGRDAVIGFAGARYVEISDERRPLLGEPGALYEVDSVLENTITIKHAPGAPPLRAQFAAQPTLRRWDGRAPIATSGWTALEDGVEVEFAPGGYAVGDFWAFEARTLTADVQWPSTGGVPEFRPRAGVEHVHCVLALVDRGSDGRWTVSSDCRNLFTPLTGQTRISMAGGDGQEIAAPLPADGALPYPLEVAVMNARRPLAGARVRFAVEEGGGTLKQPGSVVAAASVDVAANARGIASCAWLPNLAGERHRVVARLLDRAAQPLDAPLHFNARIAQAGGGGVCTVEARPGDDLQTAIEQLRPDGGELCLAAGVYDLKEPLRIQGQRRVTITGRGPATILRGSASNLLVAVRSTALTIRMIRFEAQSQREHDFPGVLSFSDCEQVKVLDSEVVAADGLQKSELACIASEDTLGRAELHVERCRLLGAHWMTGILVDSGARVRLVANDISLSEVRRLPDDLVVEAIAATPAVLSASLRLRASEATTSLRVGEARRVVKVVADDPRAEVAWSALGMSLALPAGGFEPAPAIEEFGGMLRADLERDKAFGQRSEAEIAEREASGAADAATAARERALVAIGFKLRVLRIGIALRGGRLLRVEVVRNVVGPASLGLDVDGAIDADPDVGKKLSNRVLADANVFGCAVGVDTKNVHAISARTVASLTITETRAELARGWAVDAETARENLHMSAILVAGTVGAFVTVRHSDIEGFPTGVVVRPDHFAADEEVTQRRMWIVAETMCEMGLQAADLHPHVIAQNNHASFA